MTREMTVKHTPGPWRVEKASDGYQICYNGLGNWLAEVFSDGTSEEMAEADARLIAAAPDLLALAIQYRDDMRRTPSEESRERRLEAINAAIAKAEGRS